MALPEVVSREEWTAARTRPLAAEKQATRAREALNAERRPQEEREEPSGRAPRPHGADPSFSD